MIFSIDHNLRTENCEPKIRYCYWTLAAFRISFLIELEVPTRPSVRIYWNLRKKGKFDLGCVLYVYLDYHSKVYTIDKLIVKISENRNVIAMSAASGAGW